MLDLCQQSPRRAQRSNVLSCRFFVRLDSQESHTTHYDREPDNGVVSSGNRDHPQCHATRSCASLRGCNPDVRQLSIPAGAILCFGLKIIAKSDPIPRPTKRNVIAEYKSYSLSFLAPSISTSLHALLQNMKQRTTLVDCMNRATLPKPLFSCRCVRSRYSTTGTFRPLRTTKLLRAI